MKKVLFSIFLLSITFASMAQTKADYSKLSSHLINIVNRDMNSAAKRAPGSNIKNSYILALVTTNDTTNSDEVFEEYGCKISDKLDRIYIVNIPIDQLAPLSLDYRIERIEAERMPKPAMDTTPWHINATNIYKGTNLPQAFTGKEVVSGIFDCYFDFTHPAFFDKDGNTRIKYYYDTMWPNEDGTLGYCIDNPEEIIKLEHSQYTRNHTHGTHVAGTMAGSAVDGKYMGMAPESDIYLVDFNSDRADFENPNEHTSATAVLGFKYIFDKAKSENKPCVINFSSCESITLSRQRILEGEALQKLVGPGRIIVAACGNMGHQIPYMEKTENMYQAGAAITNGIGGGDRIYMDIVTSGNQDVRMDFWSIKLLESYIENTIKFNTDSIKSLAGDTCILKTSVSVGDIVLKIYKSDYKDDRGDVFHIDGTMPHMAYLMLYGTTFLLTGDSPAWLYSDLFYSPFANIEDIPEYNTLVPGYSVSWPATLPFIVSVGATGYKSTFKNIYGEENTEVGIFSPDAIGKIAKFSSLGPTFDGIRKPDVVAPGMCINAAYNSFSTNIETDKKSLTDKVRYNNKDYYYMAQSGTSMAAPIVAGTIALWLQANPNLTPDDIFKVIAESSQYPDNEMEYPNNTYGHGQIDAYKGLLKVLDIKTNIPDIYEHQPQQARFIVDGTILRVEFNNKVDAENIDISIFSINGEKKMSTNDTTIDISHLPKGVYAVQLNTGNRRTSGSTLIRL